MHYLQCPVCNNDSISYSFSAHDHTVSKKVFEIWKCDSCFLLFTQDAPKEAEIGDYYKSPDYISHTESTTGLINKVYHFIRNFTLRTKKQLIEKETGIAAGKLLDVGSGTGAFLHTMKQGGWQIAGVEPDEDARNKASALYNVVTKAPEELKNFPDGHFDVVTLWHVLEHVHDLHRYISTIKKLLGEKGKIFIAVPNHTSADAENYKEHWAAFDVPRHLYHFSPHSMNVLLSKHGLIIKKMKPM
ncbi:MAG: class I SAM-dependent methyltransferase [Ferruginibacter sp.]